MCGIAGILRIHDPSDGPPPHPLEAIPEAWLDVLDESIKHRGPDGQGRFRDRATRDDGTVVDVAFVHRRLSIIDHEGGHQPMVHDGTRLRPDLTYQPGETPKLAHELAPADESPELVAVVFNGCIYNHRELRAELEAQGHVFETDHSDTEVLAHGTRSKRFSSPADMTGYMNWMGAALIWQRRLHGSSSLHTIRDRFGEKSLCVGYRGSRSSQAKSRTMHTFYASEPSGLPHLPAQQNVRAANRHLIHGVRHGWSHGDGRWRTVPPNSRSVRSRTMHRSPINVDPRNLIWESREHTEPLSPEKVDHLLRTAVHRRLESDTSIACFLSGGIDSALIASYAAEVMPQIETLTMAMPDARYDESAAASATAQHLGVRHSVLGCDPDPCNDLVRLIESIGMPFGDSSLLPTYWTCRTARQIAPVALSGDGGDELFCGYQRHAVHRLMDDMGASLSILPEQLIPARDPRSRLSKLRRLVAASKLDPIRRGADLASVFNVADLQCLIGDHWVLHNITLDCPPGRFERSSPVRSPREWDLVHYLTGDLLRKTDTASMAVALEVRCPFLDPELAKAAILAPVSDLMPGGQRKGRLKQVARKYLPDHIVDRPKQGFAIPIGEWFRSDYGGMRTLLYDHLESANPFPGLGEAGVEINMAFVRRLLREHDAAGERSLNPWHGRDHSQRLYMLLVLSIWAKWLERVRSEPALPND